MWAASKRSLALEKRRSSTASTTAAFLRLGSVALSDLPSPHPLPSPNDAQPSAPALLPGQKHTPLPQRPEQPRRHRARRIWDSSYLQVALLGFVCFLGPGMFNALSGMGGTGLGNPSASVKANIAIYSVFAGMAFFSGSVHNLIGSVPILFIGSLGYCLYTGSFLSYDINENTGFVIASGAILGLCASFLWTGQGALMLSYPTEENKGKAIALFWVIFNLGGVLGSALEMGLAWKQPFNSNSTTISTYIAFTAITGAGCFVTLLLRPPAKMIRSDGSRVIPPKQLPWHEEMLGMVRVLRKDPWILLLVPLALASNYCYAWQQTVYNGYFFSLRTRGLNSLLYWLAQMLGAVCIGLVLDTPYLARRHRAWAGWALTTTVCWVVWGGSYHVLMQLQDYYNSQGLTLRQYSNDANRVGLDMRCGYHRVPCDDNPWRESNPYAGRAILMLTMGLIDACTQIFCYALFGMLSNDISKLAYITGLYKSVQSAGNVAGWGMENNKRSIELQLGVAWALNVGALLFVVPLLIWRVTNHTTFERELNDELIIGAAEDRRDGDERGSDDDW